MQIRPPTFDIEYRLECTNSLFTLNGKAMYFLLLSLLGIIIASVGPKTTIRVTELTILDSNTPEDAMFDGNALIEVADHPAADTLVLKMVTCPLSHERFPDGDRLEMVNGYQHAVALALDIDGNIISDADALAALPCPPHCEGGYITSTLAYFLSTH